MQPEDKGSYWQPQTGVPQGAAAPQFSGPPQEGMTLPRAEAPAPLLSWQASEYIHHEKQGMWFAVLIGSAAVLVAIAVFLMNSYTFAVLIVVMTIALIVFAVRPPRIMNYELSGQGIRVNEKHYRYEDFRYFGILEDGPLYSAQLISTKRLGPSVSVYFPEEYGEEIVDMLGDQLPMHQIEPDFIDKLMRRLRF